MDWSKVKTGMILFLVAVNLLLLGVQVVRVEQDRGMERRNEERLAVVLRENGVSVAEKCALPPSTPQGAVVTMSRDLEAEHALAASLFGEDLQEQAQGDNHQFESSLGWIWFRGNGNLDLSVEEPGALTERGLAQALGVDSLGENHAVGQRYGGYRIFNGGVQATLDQEGSVTSAAGRWVLGTDVRESTGRVRSGTAALLSFAALYGELTPVLEETELGYLVAVSTPEYLELTPVWRFRADGKDFYISAVTGAEEMPG